MVYLKMKRFSDIKFIAILLFLFAFTASSCSISFEKRRYRPGYHVEVSKKYKRTIEGREDAHVNSVKNETVPVIVKRPKLIIEKVQNVHIVSNKVSPDMDSVKMHPIENRIKGRKHSIKKDGCDLLVMTDGVSMEVIVLEISETEIKYKKCNNPDGPTYIVPCEKVEVIHLKNGDYYRPNPDAVQVKEDDKRDRMNEYLTATMVMAIINIASTLLGFIFVFIASFLVQYIGFIIACITLAESIIVFSLGFGGLKSKDLRATIAIIIGFIAFLLSILAIIIMFL